jgi:hypothetical protein
MAGILSEFLFNLSHRVATALAGQKHLPPNAGINNIAAINKRQNPTRITNQRLENP